MADRNKKSLIVLSVGVLLNVALAIMKLYVGLRTNSICILLDSTNSFIDIVSCLLGILAFGLLAGSKGSATLHGYGRAEYVSGFLVSALAICQSAVFLYQSLTRLTMPTPVWYSLKHCIIILVALAVKVGMTVMYAEVNKRVRSATVRAITLDSFLDIGITATAVIVFLVSSKINYAIDSIFGIVLSVAICVFGVKLTVDNFKLLLGRKATPAQRELVTSIAEGVEGVKSVGEITLHDYGYNRFSGTVLVETETLDLSAATDCCKRVHDALLSKTMMNITAVPVALEQGSLAEQNDLEE